MLKIKGKAINIADTKDERYVRHFNAVMEGRWEPNTFDIFDKFIDSSHSYIDLGAWIGLTVLYGAHTAKHVYTAEPDHVALKYLKENINANKELASKISLYEGVVSNIDGSVRLASRKKEYGCSGSSVMITEKDSIGVDSMTFNSFVEKYSITDCNFIKIDIEGAEALVLPTMVDYIKEYKPVLYLSLHQKFMSEAEITDVMEALTVYDKFYNEYLNEVDLKDAMTLKSIVAM